MIDTRLHSRFPLPLSSVIDGDSFPQCSVHPPISRVLIVLLSVKEVRGEGHGRLLDEFGQGGKGRVAAVCGQGEAGGRDGLSQVGKQDLEFEKEEDWSIGRAVRRTWCLCPSS